MMISSMGFELGFIGIRQYPLFRSSVVNNLALPRSLIVSAMIGMWGRRTGRHVSRRKNGSGLDHGDVDDAVPKHLIDMRLDNFLHFLRYAIG